MTKHDSPVLWRYGVHTSKIILSISASVKKFLGALFGAQEPRSPTPPPPPPQTLALKPAPGAITAVLLGLADPDPTEQDTAEGG